MENTFTVTFEGDHVLVITAGDKDFQYMNRLWREIVLVCDRHECYNVLGLATTTTPVEAVDGYDLPGIFRALGIGSHYRIAWVEQEEEARGMLEFIVSVLQNRGLPGRFFDSEAEARAWLLGPG